MTVLRASAMPARYTPATIFQLEERIWKRAGMSLPQ